MPPSPSSVRSSTTRSSTEAGAGVPRRWLAARQRPAHRLGLHQPACRHAIEALRRRRTGPPSGAKPARPAPSQPGCRPVPPDCRVCPPPRAVAAGRRPGVAHRASASSDRPVEFGIQFCPARRHLGLQRQILRPDVEADRQLHQRGVPLIRRHPPRAAHETSCRSSRSTQWSLISSRTSGSSNRLHQLPLLLGQRQLGEILDQVRGGDPFQLGTRQSPRPHPP